MSKTIASLFEEEPAQWGLRGDPHLWREMREYFKHTPLPASADILVVQIGSAFLALTEHSISEKQHFHIERFGRGGMSGGYISPEFWREKVIPLLQERFDKLGK